MSPLAITPSRGVIVARHPFRARLSQRHRNAPLSEVTTFRRQSGLFPPGVRGSGRQRSRGECGGLDPADLGVRAGDEV